MTSDGTTALGNGQIGLEDSGSSNTIGGTSLAAANVISGNDGNGIELFAGAADDVVLGNYVGTDSSGTRSIPNSGNGIFLDNTSFVTGVHGNTIGGTASGSANIISGNGGDGILLSGEFVSDNIVEGNCIGTNLTGTEPIANAGCGVGIAYTASANTIGGASIAARNIISGNDADGIDIFFDSTATNVIQGNFVGISSDGITALGNAGSGITVESSASGNVIGGTADGEVNVISGNRGDGILLSGALNNVLAGNYVGTDASGTVAVGNWGAGIELADEASNNTIGATTSAVLNSTTGITSFFASNVISGNVGDGIDIVGSDTWQNVVEGNYIGTNASGSAGLGNGGDGVFLGSAASYNTIGGTSYASINIISGNAGDGIDLTDPTIQNNYVNGDLVGTDSTGMSAVGNQGDGIDIGDIPANNTIGGTALSGGGGAEPESVAGRLSYTAYAVRPNTVGPMRASVSAGATPTAVGAPPAVGVLASGNLRNGINLVGQANVRRANYFVGTDILGFAAVPNHENGILVTGGSNADTITQCLISGNLQDGILFTGQGVDNNAVNACYIGTNITGTKAIPNQYNGVDIIDEASDNTIGAAGYTLGNLISGNLLAGVAVGGDLTDRNEIIGNFIGTDSTGTIRLGNVIDGVYVTLSATRTEIGEAQPALGNVISGNEGAGVEISGPGTSNDNIEGNYIGLAVNGAASVPNGNTGVYIWGTATNDDVGGTMQGAGNVISGNGGSGVTIAGVGTSSDNVEGNYIGTDGTGTQPLGNATDGVDVLGGATNNEIGGTVFGSTNVLSANGGSGVNVSGSGTSNDNIESNLIGTDVTGTQPLGNQVNGAVISGGASGNTIGGSAAGEGNVIAANVVGGAAISDVGTSSNNIEGNIIGTDPSEAISLPNGYGVLIENAATSDTVGGAESGDGNTILDNTIGVGITGSNTSLNKVEGNDIEANGTYGVQVSNGATNNTIGGTESGAGNSIVSNLGAGVSLSGNSTSRNHVEGNTITGNAAGIDIGAMASSNTIGGTESGAGNVISGNLGDGIDIHDVLTELNAIEVNDIGVDSSGGVAMPNHGNGVYIFNGAELNDVGGEEPGAANVISANGVTISGTTWAGVAIGGAATIGNKVDGNFIGTNNGGTVALGNNGAGVLIENGAANNEVGSAVYAARNDISGNKGPGVEITGSQTKFNTVENNYIGSNISGTVGLRNTAQGVLISAGAQSNSIGGTDAGVGNLISGNGGAGVDITGTSTSSNVVAGNDIGTDNTGVHALANTGYGVVIENAASGNTIGASVAGVLNIIAAHTTQVLITGTGTASNVVEGDYIGVAGNGTASLGGSYGVQITSGASGNTIGGTTVGALDLISGSSTAGVYISGASANVVEGDYIGTDSTGAHALANPYGVQITGGATGNTIGGQATLGATALGASNIISGNTSVGVQLTGTGVSSNVVEGNYVGTNLSGAALSDGYGVQVTGGATANTIGGTSSGTGNLVSRNYGGIRLDSAGTSRNVVAGNLVGTSADGTSALPNTNYGMLVILGATNNTIGGTTVGARNVVSGNTGQGIYLANTGTSGNVIDGNLIGTNLADTAALPNTSNGVQLSAGVSGNTVGGTTAGAENVISGNTNAAGIEITGSGTSSNVVEGNAIGTNAAGSTALANRYGVEIDTAATSNIIGGIATFGGTVLGASNIISANTSVGVYLTGSGVSSNVVEGNYVGTNPSGGTLSDHYGIQVSAGATGNVIGGTVAGAGNVASGNYGGIRLDTTGTSGNLVAGNLVGTNATGNAAVANSSYGILVIQGASNNTVGGTTAAAANVVSGNTSGIGVYLTGASGNLIEGNKIGTDSTGTTVLANTEGIDISGSASTQANNIIGGTTAAFGNVVSGNSSAGIVFANAGTTGNVIEGNFIGTDASGTIARPNGTGVEVEYAAANNIIGGTAAGAGNVISGNAGQGIYLANTGTTGNLVASNLIGTNVGDSASLPNTSNGIKIAAGAAANTVGGTTAGAENVISGNTNAAGIEITGSGTSSNVVEGNAIGTNAAGSTALANRYGVEIDTAATSNIIGGIATFGGTVLGASNIISANTSVGVYLTGSGVSSNVVEGNYVGTNPSGGTLSDHYGIQVSAGATGNVIGGTVAGAGNVASGNYGGIRLDTTGTSGNLVAGNLVGTNAAGNAAVANSSYGILVIQGASNNTVGGTTAAAANVVSGNTSGIGVYLTGASGNLIEGNKIGTDSTGTTVLANTEGIDISGSASTQANNIIGGTTAAARNVISGNSTVGILFANAGTTGNLIEGNSIGTDASATIAEPNGAGVQVEYSAANNTIGGTVAGAGNVIADNTGTGVIVGRSATDTATTGDSVLGNSIYGNGGLGIDLGNNGVTPNSPGGPHSGPNNFQNYPVLSSATSGSGGTVISGTLNSTPSMTFRIELFSSPTASSSGYGQGQSFLGYVTVTTDSSGNASFTATFTAIVPAGQVISATATDSSGNTSEFSHDVTVTSS